MTASLPANQGTAGPRRGRLRVLALGAGLLAWAAAAGASEVRVQVSGAQVDLDATSAPLSEVLDRLARQTGMKLVFDGAAPRPLVTISVHGRSPTQTVLAVFEGLGINYALLSDESGIQVQKLLVTGAATASSSTARGPSASMRTNRNMPMSPVMVDEPPVDDTPPADDFSVPGNGNEAGAASPAPEEPTDNPSPAPSTPGAVNAPPPYTPSPFLPTAPNTVQPLQPFPAPTPTAPPQGMPGAEKGPQNMPFMP